MIGNYHVITLCGSTRFKEDFERVNKELTLAGNIVLSVGCFGHSGDVFTEEQKVMLDDKQYSVSASTGSFIKFPEKTEADPHKVFEMCLKEADTVMYEEKRAHRVGRGN